MNRMARHATQNVVLNRWWRRFKCSALVYAIGDGAPRPFVTRPTPMSSVIVGYSTSSEEGCQRRTRLAPRWRHVRSPYRWCARHLMLPTSAGGGQQVGGELSADETGSMGTSELPPPSGVTLERMETLSTARLAGATHAVLMSLVAVGDVAVIRRDTRSRSMASH